MEDTLRPPFDRILREYLEPMIPDRVLLGVLEGVSDEKSRAQELAPLIRSDRGYQGYLFAQTFLAERMKEWIVENEGRADRDEILLTRILGLLGKTPVRNLLACARIERLLGEALPAAPIPDERKIVVTPSKVIPFALEAERLCLDSAWIAPGVAFAAGLHYDCLAAILKKRGGTPDDKVALEAAFKEGLRLAKVAYPLGQQVREIRPGDRLFAAGLLLPIGKALMARLFPKSAGDRSWAEFQKQGDALGVRALEVTLLREPRRFPVAHWELSSLFVNFGAVLRDIELAIYCYPDPERLHAKESALYPLAILLSISVRLASPARPTRLEGYQQRWLKANGIDVQSIGA